MQAGLGAPVAAGSDCVGELRRVAPWLGLRPALYFRPCASVVVTPTTRVVGAGASGRSVGWRGGLLGWFGCVLQMHPGSSVSWVHLQDTTLAYLPTLLLRRGCGRYATTLKALPLAVCTYPVAPAPPPISGVCSGLRWWGHTSTPPAPISVAPSRRFCRLPPA